MKRPLALAGFVILISFFILSRVSFEESLCFIAILSAFLFIALIVKKLRKDKILLCILISMLIFTTNFVLTETYYLSVIENNKGNCQITGTVCETPKSSQFSTTYIIKVQGENYKIRYISQDGRGFKQGDIVSGTVKLETSNEEIEYFESGMASRVYFSCFETEEYFLENTGETNIVLSSIGTIKEWFVNVVNRYLPGENGNISIAMAIGDKTKISEETISYFNYSGTAHLLVVSGLHLSLWSLSIINILEKKSALRKYTVPVGIGCLIVYSALTGFSVSVLRAGAMVFTTLLGRFFKRDSDSINSIGFAVVLIMLINPFSAYSASFWLTLLSTLGILVYSKRLKEWIDKLKIFDSIREKGWYKFISSSFSISISTAIFTMPVFILKFGIMPIASCLSNLLMVEIAMIFMVLTVAGAILHLIGIIPLAEMVFSIVGAIGNYLQTVAEKIGMWEWSTISVDHRFYDYFAIFLFISVAIVFFAYRKDINIIKPASVGLAIIFSLTSLYCTAYEYNTPRIEVNVFEENVMAVVTFKGHNVVVGCGSGAQTELNIDLLKRHNEKQIDTLIVADQNDYTTSRVMKIYGSIPVEDTLFCNKIPANLCDRASLYSEPISIENLTIDMSNGQDYCEIIYKNVNLLIINSVTCENVFELEQKYDIIILPKEAENALPLLSSLKRDENSRIAIVESGQNLNLNLEQERIYAVYN